MTLSEELTWRGFIHQTTLVDVSKLDINKRSFYLGVDPSADSMHIGNLAIIMLVRHLIKHGHNAFMLVGGATGMIGDPDGKKQERDQLTIEEIEHNKQGIASQYNTVLGEGTFIMVDNYDWFKDMGYLTFLRDVGKHVPMRTMLSRDFVTSRLGEDGAGISYAEFSYSLIQGYDFLHLHREHDVSLQVCGADQWGNCIAGVDLTRRVTGDSVDVLSSPLIVNKTTGVKFGKTENGAVWLDARKTSPTQFYQFWINTDDAGVESYLKIYTLLTKDEIEDIMKRQLENPSGRVAQKRIAAEVTTLVHGKDTAALAAEVTDYLTGVRSIAEGTEASLAVLKNEIGYSRAAPGGLLTDCLVSTGLASSIGEARRLIAGNAISINGNKVTNNELKDEHFINGRLLMRRGKAFKDSALIEFSAA